MFPGQEFIYVNFKQFAEFEHYRSIRKALSVLPFGNSSVRNTELFREEQLKDIESLLTEASEKAKRCGVTFAELQEILELVYGGDES
jgi:hypothetical protein